MSSEKRNSTRYREIGRITAPELCPIPGILDDISLTGLRIHYSYPLAVNMDTEYDLKITTSSNSDEKPLNLICLPQWISQNDDNTSIGFKILYSPDANRLNIFIQRLQDLDQDQLPEIK